MWKTTFPESGTTTYAYAGKRLMSKKDAKGQKIAYEYDGHGRVKFIRREPWSASV